jgi:hypothetical protein
VVTALAERVEAMERVIEKVPDYGQTIMEGIVLARSVSGDDRSHD